MNNKIEKEEVLIVDIGGKTKEIKCDMLKLANTMWNKEGEKYTEKEMWDMGFKRK